MDERGGKEMEKEVKPYYEDDYQSLDEVDTADLLEMKEGALNDLNESERTIHRINQILASRAIYATQLELFQGVRNEIQASERHAYNQSWHYF